MPRIIINIFKRWNLCIQLSHVYILVVKSFYVEELKILILKLVLLVSAWSLAHFNAGDSHSTPRRGGFAIKEAMAKLIATVVQYTCLCPHVTGFSWSTNDLPLVINMATMHHPMHI